MTRILIVDDDPDVVEAVHLVLAREGYVVEGAANRLDGMDVFLRNPPDLLIVDMMMEDADDGLQMAREVRAHGSAVPILMLTSVDATTGLAAGEDGSVAPVDEFQSKPIDPRVLVATVAGLLARRG